MGSVDKFLFFTRHLAVIWHLTSKIKIKGIPSSHFGTGHLRLFIERNVLNRGGKAKENTELELCKLSQLISP